MRTVTEDPLGSSPFPVPGSEDVLFLSARTGLASIWLASPGKPDRQITNIGKTNIDKSFVPVFGRELVWLPDSHTRKAVFTASYGKHALWLLDIDSGKAIRLGPGRLPTLKKKDTVQAVNDNTSSLSVIVEYSCGGRP